MKTRVSLKYFVSYCLWKVFLDFNSPQTPLNLISLKLASDPSKLNFFDVFGNSKAFHSGLI